MADQIFITDDRMLALMKWAVDKGIAESNWQYLEAIGYAASNVSRIRSGQSTFTSKQILKAAQLTGANVNWIFGLENNMLKKESKSALDQLKAAVVAIEAELPKKKTSRTKGHTSAE